MRFKEIVLRAVKPGRSVFKNRGRHANAAQQRLQRRLRLARSKREAEQNHIRCSAHQHLRHLHIEARLAQVERNTLRGQLHRRIVLCRKRQRRRRQTPAQFARLVDVAIRWKQKSIAGEFRRQQAGCDLALFLKDEVRERTAIDSLRDGGTQVGIEEYAGVGNRKRQQGDRRRGHHCQVLFAGLPELLGGNFNHVGAPHAQVEPLVPYRLVSVDFDLVQKGTALPAGVVRHQAENSIRHIDPAQMGRFR